MGSGAGPDFGVNLSKDTCRTWTQICHLNPSDLYESTRLLSLPQGGLLAGTPVSGILRFSVDGDSLGPWNAGLTTLNVLALEIGADGFVYAGTDDGIWRRPLSQLATSVNSAASEPPSGFKLRQNYPNPCNPVTTIAYELPAQAHVSLRVFNMLGQEVAVLADELQERGYKTVQFDASGLSSGVYLYRLNADQFVLTKKLIVLK